MQVPNALGAWESALRRTSLIGSDYDGLELQRNFVASLNERNHTTRIIYKIQRNQDVIAGLLGIWNT